MTIDTRIRDLWRLLHFADDSNPKQDPAKIAEWLEKLASLIREKHRIPTKESS